MRKLLAVLSLVLILLAFVACSDDAGSSGGTAPSGMSAAEEKIFNKYGADVFYFAELADVAASNAELVEEICGAEESGRAAIISMYSSYGLQITNASGTTVSFKLVEEGNTITVDVTNVHIEPSKGLNDSISYDADISVSGKESHSAQMSLEIDLMNNTTTITKGKYKTIAFGTGSDALSNANNCLKEIMALDDSGEGSGSEPYNPSPYNPGPSQAWDGKDSIPYNDEIVLDHLTEGISKFKIKYVEFPVPGSNAIYNEYTYGQYLSNIAWATRRDYCDSEYDPDFEPLFVGAGIDRDPGHQMTIVYQDNAVSDYLCFEQDNDTGDWSFNMPFTYDEEEDWYDAYGTWLDNDEFKYFSYLLYPYSEIGKLYNGKYKKLSGTVEICGRTCDKYQYVNDTLYIDDEGLCLRWTIMDGKGAEQIKYSVTEFDTAVATPPFEGIADSLPDSWDY